jgi:hypothetical protein
MLTQCHQDVIKGFMGQTTDFKKKLIKSSVLILGETKAAETARYIHGEMGQGTWTFYGGHDPEDYQHFVGDPPTDLNLHPNSPGYRLILNNILFPAAKKEEKKNIISFIFIGMSKVFAKLVLQRLISRPFISFSVPKNIMNRITY